ncbi:hypothetical protein CBR_g26021 [Chara braunii]|uniref:Uncharacterized protein n=1 Tax=Chara braunii TaxID=69332 RepID=A0A388L7A4_CHABU|nr:hypothetical protein CBR_g26021 [Chara braunii]|eukprot:GBG78083.1 hypothetical protein CBR_g26021 [Chara braunii]
METDDDDGEEDNDGKEEEEDSIGGEIAEDDGEDEEEEEEEEEDDGEIARRAREQEKFEKVWDWYAEEMACKEKERKEKEQKQREKEERKRSQEAEEERTKAKKERQEFEASLGKMVKDNMKEVCEHVLGKKSATSQEASMSTDIRRKEQEARWQREDAAAREQLQRQKDEDIECLKKEKEDLVKIATGKASKELDSLRSDDQALAYDVLRLKEEMKELKCGSKRGAEAVTEKAPPEEPAKGKTKTTMDGQTPNSWAKLAEAYRRVYDEKDMADREVSARKERINRIKLVSPSSSRRKTFRRKSLKERSGGDQVKVTFIRKVEEDRDMFYKRVLMDISKLRKAQMEMLCKDEEIEYVGIKKIAGDVADIYTARAFERPTKRKLLQTEREEEQEVDNQNAQEDTSADVAETSANGFAGSESS